MAKQINSGEDIVPIQNILAGLAIILLPFIITIGYGLLNGGVRFDLNFLDILLIVSYIEAGVVLAALVKSFSKCALGIMASSIVFAFIFLNTTPSEDFVTAFGAGILVYSLVPIVFIGTLILWGVNYSLVNRKKK